MGAARFQAAFQHGKVAQPFQHLIAGIGIFGVRLTGRVDRHLFAVGLVAAMVAFHKALILGKAAIHDGVVRPLHAVHCHLLGKADVALHHPLPPPADRWCPYRCGARCRAGSRRRCRPLQCHSRALTRVPSGLPGAGCTTMPLGLLTTSRCHPHRRCPAGSSAARPRWALRPGSPAGWSPLP